MMSTFLIVRYLHFIGIFLVVAALFFEAIYVTKEMTAKQLKLLTKIDGLYGLGEILTTGMGLWMWLGELGKPASFYGDNWVFTLKFSLFILVGLLSIYPTVFFIKKAKMEEIVQVPTIIKKLIYIELIIVFIMPWLAGLMARGIDQIF
jgi:putative membrane protein